MTTQTFTETLIVEHCCNCGVAFGMARETYDQRINDRGWFYCPAGHQQHYTGQTAAEKQQARAEEAERQLRFARQNARFYQDQAHAERRSAAAYKGHATRIRNLVANGICPVPGCRRNFENVREHMSTQHPEYHEHEAQT